MMDNKDMYSRTLGNTCQNINSSRERSAKEIVFLAMMIHL